MDAHTTTRTATAGSGTSSMGAGALNEQLFDALFTSLAMHAQRPAFRIGDHTHTYAELGAAIGRVRAAIARGIPEDQALVGVVANDDLLTYASLLALWAEGRAYLPLSPEVPTERNAAIIARAGIKVALSSDANDLPGGCSAIRTADLSEASSRQHARGLSDDRLAYVLFTSGSTGEPKGVPITRGNVAAFVTAFDALGVDMGAEDRCLQMFELTFDLSVMSYLIPLLHGACVFTVPKEGIKYGLVADLLDEQRITVALMVPSIINHLRPYFEEIDCPHLRCNLFCGEALPADVTEEWSSRVPNARLLNVYGPTEHTIFCTWYEFRRGGMNKQVNGVLSIGRAMAGSSIAVADEHGRILPAGEKGELCLAGPQLTPGYWNDPARTGQVMFEAEHDGVVKRFYRTGDLSTIDAEGDALYLGRLDHQVKIQGYRVELAEIEHHARELLRTRNAVAFALTTPSGNQEIGLAIEGPEEGVRELITGLRGKLPAYMVPSRTAFIERFPLNANGKIDRKALLVLFTPKA